MVHIVIYGIVFAIGMSIGKDFYNALKRDIVEGFKEGVNNAKARQRLKEKYEKK